MAGNELATDQRQDMLWVVILLTDGVPNAGHNRNTADSTICPGPTTGQYLGASATLQSWDPILLIATEPRSMATPAFLNMTLPIMPTIMADYVGLPYTDPNTPASQRPECPDLYDRAGPGGQIITRRRVMLIQIQT